MRWRLIPCRRMAYSNFRFAGIMFPRVSILFALIRKFRFEIYFQIKHVRHDQVSHQMIFQFHKYICKIPSEGCGLDLRPQPQPQLFLKKTATANRGLVATRNHCSREF